MTGSLTNGLVAVANGYLAALTANDPGALPLAGGVRVTENGYPVELGLGLFETAGEVTYRHIVADGGAGQVVAFTVVREGRLLVNACVRLAVAGGRITEIETIVARRGGASVAAPEKLTEPHPLFAEALAPGDRRPRGALVATAARYFEALESDSGDVPFHPDCDRVENGQATTNRGPRAMSAKAQFERKVFSYITRVRGRRFPLVDEERGVVLALVLMDVPAREEDFARFPVPVDELPARMVTPRTIMLAELFKVAGDQIRHIDAVMVNVALGATSGW
jgi:hypothetical protein